MTEVPTDPKGFSLRRWSQRKHAAARGSADDMPPAGSPVPQVVATSDVDRRTIAGGASPAPAVAGSELSMPAGAPPPMSAEKARSNAVPLPALDTLTLDSDYTPFMQPGVDDAVKRSALKKLFADPRFNVMDGLDVYIADYSKPDPIDPAIVRTLVQARYIFNPPATRVNAQGHVEDIPDAPVGEEASANDVAPPVLEGEASLDETAGMPTQLPPVIAETAGQSPAELIEPPAEPPPVRNES